MTRSDRLAARVQVKERQAAFLRRDLRVIPARLERRSGLATRDARSARPARSRGQRHAATSGLAAGSDASKTTSPRGPSTRLEPAAERVRHAGARGIGAAEAVDQRRRELGRPAASLRARSIAALIDSSSRTPRDGTGVSLRRIAGGDARAVSWPHRAHRTTSTSSQSWSSASIQNTATAGTPCSRSHLLGESKRGQCFQQREERSAKQARLLAGDDGNGLRIAKERQLPRRRHLTHRERAAEPARRRQSRRVGGDADACERWRRATPPDRPDCPRKSRRRVSDRRRSRPPAAGSREIAGYRWEAGRSPHPRHDRAHRG